MQRYARTRACTSMRAHARMRALARTRAHRPVCARRKLLNSALRAVAHPGGDGPSDASDDEGKGRVRAPSAARGDDESSGVEEEPPRPKKHKQPRKDCPFIETESKEDRRGGVVSDDEAEDDVRSGSNEESASEDLEHDDDDDDAQENEVEATLNTEEEVDDDDDEEDDEDAASYDEAAELEKALLETAPPAGREAARGTARGGRDDEAVADDSAGANAADSDDAATESSGEKGGGERNASSGPAASVKRRASASAPKRTTAQLAMTDALKRCDRSNSPELRDAIKSCGLMAAAEVLAYLTSGAEATDHRTRVSRNVCRANVLQVVLIGVVESLVRRARTKTTKVLAEYGVSRLYGLAREWGWDEPWLEQFEDSDDLANEMRRQWAVALDLALSEVLLRFDGFQRAADHEAAVAGRLRESKLTSLVRHADSKGVTLKATTYEKAIDEYATVLAEPQLASALSDVAAELEAAASAAQRWARLEEEYPSSLKHRFADNVYELNLDAELAPSGFATAFAAGLAQARGRNEDHGPLVMFGRLVVLPRAAVGYTKNSVGHPMLWLVGLLKWVLGNQVAIRLNDGNCVLCTRKDAAAIVSLTAERLRDSGQSAPALWALACRFAVDRGNAQGGPVRNPVAELFGTAADTDMSTSSTPVRPAAPSPATPPAARAPAAHVAPPEEPRAAPSPASAGTPNRAVREPAARVERIGANRPGTAREARGVAAADGPQNRSDRDGSDGSTAARDGRATRTFEDDDGEQIEFDAHVVHQEEPRANVVPPQEVPAALNPQGSPVPRDRISAATGTQRGHRTLADVSAAILEAAGRLAGHSPPADAHPVTPPSAPANIKPEPAKVKTESVEPARSDGVGRMVFSRTVVEQLLEHTAHRTLGNPKFDDKHRMVLLTDPKFGYEAWASTNGSVPGIKLAVGFENIETGEIVTLVCLAPAMVARAADRERVDPIREGASLVLTRGGDADESIDYGPACSSLAVSNFSITLTEPVARSPDRPLNAGWPKFLATVDGINRAGQDWLAGIDAYPAAARVLPSAQRIAKRNEDSQLREFEEQQAYSRFSEYLAAVTEKADAIAMSKVSPFELDVAKRLPLLLTATSRVRKAVIHGVKAVPPPPGCDNPVWDAISKASKNGMKFAYKPPTVTFFDGSELVVSTADHFTKDHEFLEEGSEVLVEARLQFLIKPDRYVVQFVLESVCALPTPPVRPTTARPSAIGAGSRAGATARRIPTSLFASVDLTGVTQSTSGRHALRWSRRPCTGAPGVRERN